MSRTGSSYRSISAARARAQQQTRRPPMLLSIDGTDGQTDGWLCKPAPPVKNWRILLVHSCTAGMPLLMAAGTFGSGRRRWNSPQECYLHCPPQLRSVRAPGRNASLIRFLISALYISFACLYRLLPHLSFFNYFAYLSPPLLIFPSRIYPLRFQAGCRKRRRNLDLDFCVFILCCSAFLLIRDCVLLLCWVLFLFNTTLRDWLGETSPK